MRKARYLVWLLFAPFLAIAAQENPVQQNPVQQNPCVLRISPGVAELNVIKKVNPQYPQMAQIAHIQGKVVLNVTIATDGKVSSLKAFSGHPILIQSAMDAVRHWEYHPYLWNGQPCAVETKVEVRFWLQSEEEEGAYRAAATVFYEREERCIELLARRDRSGAELTCAALPELSEKLGPALIHERIIAYRDFGRALSAGSKFQDALAAYQHELDIASVRLQPGDTELGRVHADLAHGFQHLQTAENTEQAQAHYQQAIKIYEAALESPPQIQRGALKVELRLILQDYAYLLRKVGKVEEAVAVENKAQALEQ